MENKSQTRMPLSPLRFNLCLKPLLKVIRKNEDVCGAYVETPKGVMRFDVQAYADDVAFISDSPEGITHMLGILDEYIRWSKTEVNVQKCTTASYVYDDERRRT
jgi:hypothetical protein